MYVVRKPTIRSQPAVRRRSAAAAPSRSSEMKPTSTSSTPPSPRNRSDTHSADRRSWGSNSGNRGQYAPNPPATSPTRVGRTGTRSSTSTLGNAAIGTSFVVALLCVGIRNTGGAGACCVYLRRAKESQRRNAAATPASTGTCRPVVRARSPPVSANTAAATCSGSTSRLSSVRCA